jgi:hypothetical protein
MNAGIIKRESGERRNAISLSNCNRELYAKTHDRQALEPALAQKENHQKFVSVSPKL